MRVEPRMRMPSRDEAIAAVERSLPNPARPRLSTEMEAHLEPIERRAALVYTDAELAVERLRALVDEVESDAVPVAELLGDDSVVNHLEELRWRAEED